MYYKKIELSILLALVFTIALSCFDFSYKCENIRQSVFRLHILANSNSEYDQKLKIKVRDRLLNEGLEVFANSEDLEETIDTKVTAQDFAFGITRAILPETDSPGYDLLSTIKNAESVHNGTVSSTELGIKVLNDYTLEITLERK